MIQQAPSPSGEFRVLLAGILAGDTGAVSNIVEQLRAEVRVFVRLCVGEELRRLESRSCVVADSCHELLLDRLGIDLLDGPRFRLWLFTHALREFGSRHRQSIRTVAGVTAARSALPDFLDADIDAALATAPPDRDPDREELNRVCLRVSLPEAVRPERGRPGVDHHRHLEVAFDALPSDMRQMLALSRIARVPHDAIAMWARIPLPDVRRRIGVALSELGPSFEARVLA